MKKKQMKTIADIKDLVIEANERIESKIAEERAEMREKVFKLYDQVPDISKVITRLENMEGGQYHINDYGDLIYSVEVPKNIRELPLINDYLTQDFASIYPSARTCGNDLFIYQNCGEFISVNFYAYRNSYFVYDHETRKLIIEKETKGMPLEYIRAKIEKHMRKQGVFGDVIEMGYHGEYLRHFETKLGNATDEEVNAIVDAWEAQNE